MERLKDDKGYQLSMNVIDKQHALFPEFSTTALIYSTQPAMKPLAATQ